MTNVGLVDMSPKKPRHAGTGTYIIGDSFVSTLPSVTSVSSALGINSVMIKPVCRLLTRARPRRIVETGTRQGLGTTLAMCQTLRESDLSADQFYSIEVNPELYAQAWNNLSQRGFHPRLLRGLSIPRTLLPTESELRSELQRATGVAGAALDTCVAALQQETHFPEALDDLLGFLLRSFDNAPDFLLLNSADPLGFIEFQYAFSLIKAPCYVALNGVRQWKHARSLQAMEADPRFKLLELVADDGGHCIAHFTP
jgi:hypothetical protein